MGQRIYANNRVLNPLTGTVSVRIPLPEIPVNDNNVITDTYFIIAFYDSSGDLVTPTGGTVAVNAEPIEGQLLGPSDGDQTFNMSDVRSTGLSPYTPPVFVGPIVGLNFTITSPAGATQYSAYAWRA